MIQGVREVFEIVDLEGGRGGGEGEGEGEGREEVGRKEVVGKLVLIWRGLDEGAFGGCLGACLGGG